MFVFCIGHGRAAFQRYETLDVKYIQLDSLGHLLCRPLISMGLPYTASPVLSSTLRFYTTHAREVLTFCSFLEDHFLQILSYPDI